MQPVKQKGNNLNFEKKDQGWGVDPNGGGGGGRGRRNV